MTTSEENKSSYLGKNLEQIFSMLSLKIILVISILVGFASSQDLSITYNGFRSTNMSLDGIAEVTPNGLLKLTNATKQEKGHAFFPNPVKFKNSANSSAFSFSTTFVFAIVSEYPTLSGHGIAFVIAPTRGLPGALPSQYLGLFSKTNSGNDNNHVAAVELDTIQSSEFNDINDNHVGIDINGLTSKQANPAGYYPNNNGLFQNLTLISGKTMQVWVDYSGITKQINVTLAPIHSGKPNRPLLSLSYDLSPILNQTMYIGFSSSTGSVLTSHYVLGWSFKMNGVAQGLDLSRLPKLPRVGPKKESKVLTIGLPVILIFSLSIVISVVVYQVRLRKKFTEVLENWELDYGPHRFKYKDLYIATNGFREKELLGTGGFGRPKCALNWSQRFRVIRGVAYGLLYLHEGWEQVVVHRDVKASNVLLDGELNGRLGDFGLARLYDHGTDPQTTHVVGTLGYLAPEHTRTGKATTSTDVYAFGAFLLEAEDQILVDWVFSCWNKGKIPEAVDPNLGLEYVKEEVELVMKLGLLCSHSEPTARPSMRQVVLYFDGALALPELSSLGISATGLTFANREGFSDFALSYPSSMEKAFSHASTAAESVLSGGR
ncbi:hypothetical protein ACH5RR_005313 [Cinchona calisaya]|uniref:non-specific serine/threonine protein kinase n=1 Tax=Cinchona calisaya TaxID=153742 RepID=A0ABD3AKV2_9GENT